MKTIRIILSIAMIVIIAGCERQQTPVAGPQISADTPEQSAQLTIQPFEVKLEVVTDSSGASTLDNKNDKNPNCKEFGDMKEDEYRKGCIVALVNEMVNVDFKLSGSGGWYFAEFQICAAPDRKKLDDFENCSLTPAQAGEWFIVTKERMAIPDNTNGRVVISALEWGLRAFRLIDINLTEANYFYRVCVKRNVADNCVWSDPAGENYGRH